MRIISRIETVTLLTLSGLMLVGIASCRPTTAISQQPTPDGLPISFGNVSLVIPAGLASGIQAETNTEVEYPYINPSNGEMPVHTAIYLNDYALADRGTAILVFKANEFAGYTQKTQNIVAALQNLPAQAIPPFPEDLLTIFTAQDQTRFSTNGHGLRYLTQVMDAFVPINNRDLFYYYQGLTADGAYYVEALLPVNVAYLIADTNPASALPTDGIPFPADPGTPSAMSNYLLAIQTKMDATDPAAFTPSLSVLDRLIDSIRVAP